MKTTDKPIPSPMTEARLAIMQRRAARQEPLAQPADNHAVTRSIAERGVSKRGKPTREAQFDDEGEAIELPNEFSLVDAYLATPIGSAAARAALARWKGSR